MLCYVDPRVRAGPVRFLPARRCATAVLAIAMCLSVCLSVTHRYCIETAQRNELVFGTVAALYLSYIVLAGNSGTSTNKGTSAGALAQTADSETNCATACRPLKVLST